mmetsp:Transcript_46761/g.109065  ORF Transcript_46761/g.109065 Transcript_46761/m.109065 type:complete len:374 (+) Transcript_46761:82-1203(+)
MVAAAAGHSEVNEMERHDEAQEVDLRPHNAATADLAAEEQRLGARIARLAELERKMHSRESALRQREESVAELEKSLTEKKQKVDARESRLEAREEALATLRRAADEREKRLRAQEMQTHEREVNRTATDCMARDHSKGHAGERGCGDLEKDARPMSKASPSPGCTTPSSGHPTWQNPQRNDEELQSPWYDTPAKVAMSLPATQGGCGKPYEAISQALAAKLSGAMPLDSPDAFITCQGENFQELLHMALHSKRSSLPSEMDPGMTSIDSHRSLLAEKAVRFQTQQEEISGVRLWQPRQSQVFRRLDMEDTPLKPLAQHWSRATEARPSGLAGSCDHSSIVGTPRLHTPMQSSHTWRPHAESPVWRHDSSGHP